MNPHPRMLLFLPSFITKSSKGTSLHISCQIVTSAVSGLLLGRCPELSCTFSSPIWGQGAGGFTAMSVSHASYACCLIGNSPGDCFQGPVYSICQLCECFTLQKLCSTSPYALSLTQGQYCGGMCRGLQCGCFQGQKVTVRRGTS